MQNQIGSIQRAFLRQIEAENNRSTPEHENNVHSDWVKEKTELENTIKVLKSELEETTAKYTKLKSKHISLLQVLLNQNIQAMKSSSLSKASSMPTLDINVASQFVSFHCINNIQHGSS